MKYIKYFSFEPFHDLMNLKFVVLLEKVILSTDKKMYLNKIKLK